MSSIRSILEGFAKYCSVQGCPFGTMPNDKDKLDQALKEISELIDGVKPEVPVADSWQRGIEKSAFEDAIRIYQYKIKELLK